MVSFKSVTRIHHLMIMVSSARLGLGKGERRSVRGFSEPFSAAYATQHVDGLGELSPARTANPYGSSSGSSRYMTATA